MATNHNKPNNLQVRRKYDLIDGEIFELHWRNYLNFKSWCKSWSRMWAWPQIWILLFSPCYYCAFWISKLDSWPTLLRVYLTLSTKKSKEVWYFVCLYQSINWLLVKTTKVTLFERNVPLDLFVFIRLTFFFFFFIFVFMQHSTFNEQTTLNLKRAYLFRYNLDRNLSIASVLIN